MANYANIDQGPELGMQGLEMSYALSMVFLSVRKVMVQLI